MAGWNLPEGVNECRCCGAPIHWPLTLCADCQPPRDRKGRFVKRPAPPHDNADPDSDNSLEET